MKADARAWSIVTSGIEDLRAESRWLIVLMALTVVELAWWALCWRAGIAPTPRISTYMAFTVAGMIGAFALRISLRCGSKRARWPVVLVGTVLTGLGASLFLPLKYAIPSEIPFWLDVPLARGERHFFGTDPWRLADGLFGWALVPMDRIYGLWLPVQSLVMFSVMLAPASPRKSRALVAYALAWFLLGTVAAVLCASAGPIFYDRLLGGHDFAPLTYRLRLGGAAIVQREAGAMWASWATRNPGLVAGISAMPSMHVAISFWVWLTACSFNSRGAPLALAYAIIIWIASVQLGWHYVTDGLAGLLGMLSLWCFAKRLTIPHARQRSSLASVFHQ